MNDEKISGDVTADFERKLNEIREGPFVLRLYIAGNSPRSQTAVENVKRICEEYLEGRCELEVIDIYQDLTTIPEDLVLAAPTLIRRLPLPLRRVIGDMTEKDKVLIGLDLIPKT
ncbi:circadian clock KaiB family protein [Methanosphaerula subterraneus]|uniref:circadian clock KaiB family protein n=1 Tax=Methanosphaerula subterraneus TaxID=3350244 RepID=UPI003F87DC72